jgi:hypothetical protein
MFYCLIVTVARVVGLLTWTLWTIMGEKVFVMMVNAGDAFAGCMKILGWTFIFCLLLSNALTYFYSPAQRAGVTSAGESGAVDVENPLYVGTVNDK